METLNSSGSAGSDPASRLAWVSAERQALELTRSSSAQSYDRQVRRELVALVVVCWIWILAGTFVLLRGMHLTEVDAKLTLLVGIGITVCGVYFSVLVWYVRSAERGDFD